MTIDEHDQGYRARHEMAKAWTREARRHLQAGLWAPTDLEKQIAADIAAATRVPSLTPPPHADEPLWWRMQRLGHWPATIRLGMRAGQWRLPSHVELPTADTRMDLPGVLAALYQPSVLIEQWSATHNSIAMETLSDAEVDARLDELVPNWREHIAAAENLFFDFGPTFIAITSGNAN